MAAWWGVVTSSLIDITKRRHCWCRSSKGVQPNVILPLTAFHVEGSSKVLDICRSGHCVVLRELKRSPVAEFRAVSKQYSHASLKDGATF